MASAKYRAIQKDFSSIAPGCSAGSVRRDYRESRELVEWLRVRARDRVLDAACGTGVLDVVLAPHVRRVFGLDLCRQMIDRGRELHRRIAPEPAFTVASVTQLPFCVHSFDLVTCSYAFANFPDPLVVLAEFARVTRPGGRIAIVEVVAPEEPARRESLNRLESLRGRLQAKIRSLDEFGSLFRKAGLAVISIQLRRRRRTAGEWLRQSPAAADPKRARLLRRMLADSMCSRQTGMNSRIASRDFAFYHRTAWFLLRRGLRRKGLTD